MREIFDYLSSVFAYPTYLISKNGTAPNLVTSMCSKSTKLEVRSCFLPDSWRFDEWAPFLLMPTMLIVPSLLMWMIGDPPFLMGEEDVWVLFNTEVLISLPEIYSQLMSDSSESSSTPTTSPTLTPVKSALSAM